LNKILVFTLRAICTKVDQKWSRINEFWIKQTTN